MGRGQGMTLEAGGKKETRSTPSPNWADPQVSTAGVTRSPRGPRTQVLDLLRRCLAIQVQKIAPLEGTWQALILNLNGLNNIPSIKMVDEDPTPLDERRAGEQDDQDEDAIQPLNFDPETGWWMYENGYLVYQSLQEANRDCWWNPALLEALKSLDYAGWANPGVLLVSGTPRSLDVLRDAYCRRVLRPPRGYVIMGMGDVDHCPMTSVPQGQFTPLPDALCWVIHDLTSTSTFPSSSSTCTLEDIHRALVDIFPDTVRPSRDLIYATLGKLIRERKVYHTQGGYGIVNPSTYNRVIRIPPPTERPLLLTNEEALEILNHTKIPRKPSLTDSPVQVSFANILKGEEEGDVIRIARPPHPNWCEEDGLGGSERWTGALTRIQRRLSLRHNSQHALTTTATMNPNLRPRARGRGTGSWSMSMRRGRSLSRDRDRERDLLLHPHPPDSYHSSNDLSHLKLDISSERVKRPGLWHRLLRDREKPQILTFGGQFPPPEWDDPRLLITHSIATQTSFTRLAQSSPNIPLKVQGQNDIQGQGHGERVSRNQSWVGRKPRANEPSPALLRSRSLPYRVPNCLSRPSGRHMSPIGRGAPQQTRLHPPAYGLPRPPIWVPQRHQRFVTSAPSGGDNHIRNNSAAPPSSLPRVQTPVGGKQKKAQAHGTEKGAEVFINPVAVQEEEKEKNLISKNQRETSHEMRAKSPSTGSENSTASPNVMTDDFKLRKLWQGKKSQVGDQKEKEKEKEKEKHPKGTVPDEIKKPPGPPGYKVYETRKEEKTSSTTTTTSTSTSELPKSFEFNIKISGFSNNHNHMNQVRKIPVLVEETKEVTETTTTTYSNTTEMMNVFPTKSPCMKDKESKPKVSSMNPVKSEKEKEKPDHPYLSLSDLTVSFKSVVGQKLLQGCSANSIDTLMELDLAAAQNKYHTLAYVPAFRRLFAFGLGGSGQLGSGRTQSSTLPVLAYEGPILDVATGGDHAFVIMGEGKEVDHRFLDDSRAIARLTPSSVSGIASLQEGKSIPYDLLSELEVVFGSCACLNASFLDPSGHHFGCARYNPGVHMPSLFAAFTTIQHCPSVSMQEHEHEGSGVELCPVLHDDLSKLLNFLSRLWESNKSRSVIISHEAFHLPRLSELVNIPLDYFKWASTEEKKGMRFCDFPFVFDASGKTILLRTDASLQMRKAQEQSRSQVFFLPFTRVFLREPEYLVLTVSRENLVDSTIEQLLQIPENQLKKPLKVIFFGEEGVDAGGVKKEFFMLLMRELLDPKYGMFTNYEETHHIWFAEDSFEEPMMYFLVGLVCGLAIYNFTIISLPFPLALYKKLLGEPTGLEDLQDLLPSVAKSFEEMLSYNGDDFEEKYDFRFEITRHQYGEVITKPLKENGSEILVTHENRKEFVDLYTQYILEQSISASLKAFSEGFHKVCGSLILRLFTPVELMGLVVGNENYDWDILESNASYKEDYSPSHPTIRLFWDVFHSLSLDEKKKFLKFLTGTDRIPILGMKAMKCGEMKVKGKVSGELPHPKSRKAAQLLFHTNRIAKREKIKAAGNSRLKCLGEKLAWIKETLISDFPTCKELSPQQTLQLIDKYLGRCDEELEQIDLKNSIGGGKRNQRKRQHASREGFLHLHLSQEKLDFESCGIEMPDLFNHKNVEYLLAWNGELRYVNNIKLKRYRRKDLTSGCESKKNDDTGDASKVLPYGPSS
ncbi:unnamed protein product [Darwinula stevensoni]|uniref:HECT-type E3 ubiquitin transferase n=1 Tax=Darwinula stevensoni TaxID=69355 RepID=A0A7R9A3P7_9CRUS|nr:unnamed protein product [Darwinula stevensoni]CAG0888423.1 unnamed protein product [Darwinula stevensoni]